MTFPQRKMALAAVVTLAGTAALSQDAPVPRVGEDAESVPNRILFIGNSYLYYGDSIHNHVVRMARAAYPDLDFTFKSATISGAYLHQQPLEHMLDHELLGLDEPFDMVILQGHSRATTEDDTLERFNSSVAEMDATIDEYGARTALYLTPAYTEENRRYDPEMFSKIERGYVEAGNATEAQILPVGLAFEMAYEARPEIELHKPFDGSHPTLLGTYLAAATVYASVYGESAVGNPYDYYGAVSADDAAFLQQIAEDAVAAFYGRAG